MKRIILIFSLLFSTPVFAEKHYVKGSMIIWKRNFEEGTALQNNEGIESTEGGLSVGYGYFIKDNLSVELELMNSMKFTVEPPAGSAGEVDIAAATIAPVYHWKWDFAGGDFSFYAKFRFGYAKVNGTSAIKPAPDNSSLTMGMGVGAFYEFKPQWKIVADFGGLWQAGDIEDYDFYPLMIGLGRSF